MAKNLPPFNYIFSEIPNDKDGQLFVKQLRKYLNKNRFDLRVKGQYLKLGLNWRNHQAGQSIKNSTHMRVYISDKLDHI